MTDSPLDLKVKHGVLTDAFKILNLSWKRKNKYLNAARRELQNRIIGAKRMTLEEREELKAKLLV